METRASSSKRGHDRALAPRGESLAVSGSAHVQVGLGSGAGGEDGSGLRSGISRRQMKKDLCALPGIWISNCGEQ